MRVLDECAHVAGREPARALRRKIEGLLPNLEGTLVLDFKSIRMASSSFHPGSVYDAISARIAEDLGFEVGMFSGSIGSMSVLGAPDLVVLTVAIRGYRA
jgi:hypothetical protein